MARASTSSDVADWHDEFRAWLAPFLAAFGREAQRHWAPVYLEGLLGPGERKSIEPMARRVCPGETQQLHHFVSTSPPRPGARRPWSRYSPRWRTASSA